MTTTTDYRQRYLVMVDRIAQAERVIQRRSYLAEMTQVTTLPLANALLTSADAKSRRTIRSTSARETFGTG